MNYIKATSFVLQTLSYGNKRKTEVLFFQAAYATYNKHIYQQCIAFDYMYWGNSWNETIGWYDSKIVIWFVVTSLDKQCNLQQYILYKVKK